MSPSASNAAVKAMITWVWVSSAETTSQIHLRDTRSMIASAAIRHRVKCVVSKIQTWLGRNSTHSGRRLRCVRGGLRGRGSRSPLASSTRSMLEGDTHTLFV